GIAGDQQASLLGQGCTKPGLAKITFGTGGMLDMNLGSKRPAFEARGPGGTFPIVAWRRGGEITWGLEAFMLTAGQAVEWLRGDRHRLLAYRRRYERQHDLRAGPGRRHAANRRGLAHPRGDDAGCGVPRRSGRRGLEGRRRRGRHVVAADARRAG